MLMMTGCLGTKYLPSSDPDPVSFAQAAFDAEHCYNIEKYGFEVMQSNAECPPKKDVQALADMFIWQHRLPKNALKGITTIYTRRSLECPPFFGGYKGCTNRNKFSIVQLQGRKWSWEGWGTATCYEWGHAILPFPKHDVTPDMSRDVKSWAHAYYEMRLIDLDERRHRVGPYRYGCVSAPESSEWPYELTPFKHAPVRVKTIPKEYIDETGRE